MIWQNIHSLLLNEIKEKLKKPGRSDYLNVYVEKA